MFNLNQINELHDRFGKKSTLHEYLLALNAIGIDKFDSFVTDGYSEYYGVDNQMIISLPVHEKYIIAQTSNKEALPSHLKLHEQGKTDYFEIPKGLAESGI